MRREDFVLRLEKKHPRAIRWFHWINFPLLSVMIASGLLIYWANPVYRLGFGSHTLLKMNISQPAWQKLHVNSRLALGMAWHFFFMWLFGINGILYVLYTATSGEWRELIPNRHSFREAITVLLHDLHLSRRKPAPRKFNGAQQIAYTSIIVMGAGSLLSGLAIYKPVQFGWLTFLMGGYAMARFIHFWLVVRAGWNNFRAMVTGYEIVTEPREEIR